MGTDATAELMNFVSDGEILLAVNSQFPRDMGAGAMRAALKAVKGEAIDEYVQLTPTKVFTSIDKIAIDTWLSEKGDYCEYNETLINRYNQYSSWVGFWSQLD